MRTVDKFEMTRLGDEPLAKVRVLSDGYGPVSFARWFNTLFFDVALFHPNGNDRHASVQGTHARWRQTRGIWATWGDMTVRFYNNKHRQVRATFSLGNKPFSKHGARNWRTEISWHLDETGLVLPALIKSIEMLSYSPLKELDLFSDSLPDSPESPVYAWTRNGDAASRPV